MKEFLKGNTQRFEFEFRDWDMGKSLFDPTSIKFIVYDIHNVKLSETLLGAENKISTGKYFFYYTPLVEGFFQYEVNCSGDGLPSLMTENFKVK